MDVGEAEVSAAVAVGESFVIEAEEVKEGGVEVVDVNFVLSSREAEFVGGSMNVSTFDSASG